MKNASALLRLRTCENFTREIVKVSRARAASRISLRLQGLHYECKSSRRSTYATDNGAIFIDAPGNLAIGHRKHRVSGNSLRGVPKREASTGCLLARGTNLAISTRGNAREPGLPNESFPSHKQVRTDANRCHPCSPRRRFICWDRWENRKRLGRVNRRISNISES